MKIRIDSSGKGVCHVCHHVGVVLLMSDGEHGGQWECHSSLACVDRQTRRASGRAADDSDVQARMALTPSLPGDAQISSVPVSDTDDPAATRARKVAPLRSWADMRREQAAPDPADTKR